MKFNLIIIGNELLNGKISDLNTHYLASKLYQNGHQLTSVQFIGDDEKDFKNALALSLAQADYVITCGGMGPTKDDMTKAFLANYFDKELIYSPETLELVEKLYQRNGKTYPKDERDYQYIPEGFKAIDNPRGHAPGLYFEQDKKEILAVPGVPFEFQSMVDSLMSNLDSKKKHHHIKHVIFKTWKLPESKIFNDIVPDLWSQLEAFGEVSSLPHLIGVDIAVKLVEKDKSILLKKEKQIKEIVLNSAIQDYIWHTGAESLPELVVKKATEKNITIGFSESCTGGLCASKITDISGSSSTFKGAVVSYANEAKENLLGVQSKTLKSFGAVSKETAYEMAQGVRNALNVDIAISTTGVAGPSGGSPEKPVGTVGIGFSTNKETSSEIYHFRGDRKILKERFSQYALLILLEKINQF